MKEERCILQIDKDPKAVIEPDYEKQPFKFHSKLLFAFVPKEDIDNLSDTFGKTVEAFSDITNAYGDVNSFADNFAGSTKDFAEKLITEMVDFNNGIADIGDTEGGLENYDNDKLNDWVNQLMGDIVETNESFNTLVNE